MTTTIYSIRKLRKTRNKPHKLITLFLICSIMFGFAWLENTRNDQSEFGEGNYNPIYLGEIDSLSPSAADKTLNISVYDKGSNPIVGASVEIDNNDGVTESSISDQFGHAVFSGLENDTYDITVTYSIGDKNIQYIINETNYELDIASGTTDNADIYCNLTEVNLEIGDSQLSHDIWGLYNANVTLQDPNTGNNLTSFYTDYFGHTKLYLPCTDWDLNIQYQGDSVAFFIYILGGDNSLDYVQNLTLTDATETLSYDVYCELDEVNTGLWITEFDFANDEWPNTKKSTKPYEMTMYYGESVALNIVWNMTQTGLGMSKSSDGSIWNSWTISDTEGAINSSIMHYDALQPVEDSTGNYTFIIDSEDYGSGEYTLNLVCNKTAYQDAYLILDFEIINLTSEFEMEVEVPITVKYSESINLNVNLTSTLPFEENIDDELFSLNYNIEGEDFSGQFNYNEGTENFTLNVPVNIPVGTYDLLIFGGGDNIDSVSKSYILIVDPIETDVYYTIPEDTKISSSFMKVAYGENVTFLVNFTDVNGIELTDCSFNVYVEDELLSSEYYRLLTEGINADLWNVSFASDLYSTGMYSITTELIKPNYETQNESLTVSIKEYWDSAIDIIQAPNEQNWGDNVSFQMKYRCDEDLVPASRDEKPISGAEIESLNVTIKLDDEHIEQVYLDQTSLGINWGVKDLSGQGSQFQGIYDIWVSTSLLNITEKTKFYIIPTIQEGVYAEATTRNIYFDLNTLDTELICYNNSDTSVELSFARLDQKYDETMDVLIHYNVAESTSHLDNNPLLDAEINIYIINETDSEIIDGPHFATEIGNGDYLYTIDSKDVDLGLGEFIFLVNITRENYTYSVSSFDFEITSSIDFSIIIPTEFREGSSAMKAALKENLTFFVELGTGSEDATVEIFIDNSTEKADWCYQLDILEDHHYNCTTLGSELGVGTHTVLIVASKGEYIKREISIQIQIIAEWSTSVEVKEPPETCEWGHNQSFIINYYCSEEPRGGIKLSDAIIDSLSIGNETLEITLSDESLGSDWGWYSLENDVDQGPGYYLIWFNTSVFPINEEMIIAVAPEINGSVEYEDNSYNVALTVYPVSTSVDYSAELSSGIETEDGFNLLTLMTEENATIYFNYTVTNEENEFFGRALNSPYTTAQILVQNKSNSFVTVIEESLAFDDGETNFWTWEISEEDLSPHEFFVTVTFDCDNYTQHLVEFNLIIGQSETTFTYNIDPLLKGNPNNEKSLLVAYNENLTITVTFPNVVNHDDIWINLWLGDILLPVEDYFWISENQINYTTEITSAISEGIYDAKLQCNQIGYTPSNQSFSVKIMSYWPAKMIVVNPPRQYPWGNMVELNTSYICTEYPREGMLLTGAEISQIEIILTSEDETIQKAVLNHDDLAEGIWYYEELISTKGHGYYRICYNSTEVDLDIEDIQSYYIIPTIQTGIYSECSAKPKPNYSIYPVFTSLVIEQTSSIENLDLTNMIVYLDDELSINVHYFAISDPRVESVFNLIGLDNAVVEYRIYNSTDNSLFLSDILTLTTNGTFAWNMPTHTIGDFYVNISTSYQNFESQLLSFNFQVQKYVIEHNYDVDGGNNIIDTPKNEAANITFMLNDTHTNTPLIDADVSILFNGEMYQCYEVGSGTGIYTFEVPVDSMESLETGESYPAKVFVSKTNYTDYSFTVQVRVNLPVDPYLGIPYIYWIIMGVSIAAFVSLVVARFTVLKASVPIMIRRINNITKLISKKKDIPRRNFGLTEKEEIYRRFADDWKNLGLSLAPVIDLKQDKAKILEEELEEWKGNSDMIETYNSSEALLGLMSNMKMNSETPSENAEGREYTEKKEDVDAAQDETDKSKQQKNNP